MMTTKQLRLLGVLLEELSVPQRAGVSTMEAVAALVAVEARLADKPCPHCHQRLSNTDENMATSPGPFQPPPFNSASMN
jgi:hypothetical protein